MTNMMFGIMGNTGVPVDEAVVRSTATVVTPDKPAAMQDAPPEFNEVIESDQDPALGLTTRTLASHLVPTQKYAPFWQSDVDNGWQHNAIVDSQISTAGTAAQRETSGEFGHGTMQVAIGIEPVGDLREGGKLTNEFLQVDKRNIQTGSGDYMSIPPGYDQNTSGMVAAAGKTAAMEASNPYNVWWNGGK